MKQSMTKILALAFVTCFSVNANASLENIQSIGSINPASKPIQASSWDMKLIYQPSQSLLNREKDGMVYIYDGFSDTQVDNILDDKFGRIQNMMFTRVKITDDYGKALIDPDTGKEMVAEDGCD